MFTPFRNSGLRGQNSANHETTISIPRRFLTGVKTFFFLVLAAGPLLRAETSVYIGISPDKSPQESLFLSAFVPSSSGVKTAETALKMRDAVRQDLMYSRYFDLKEEPLEPLTLKADKEALSRFSSLSRYLVRAEISLPEENYFSLKGQIYDLESRKKIFERSYQGKASVLRKAAHLFSDDITLKITGKKGIAHTRIAFANNSTGSKEIYIADYDGENLTCLTDDRTISLLPRWSNDSSRIYYTTYRRRNPDIFEIDLRKGKISPFTMFQGLNIPGGFSPDGLDFVMTLSKGEDPNIYVMNVTTRQIKKLLTRFGVSSSPTYSPDGREIAFISDLSGNPQLYVYSLDSGKKRKLTRLNWADSPNWSPSGQWIVFSGRENRKEKMNIFLVDPTGSQIKRLTRNEGDNEDPSFSPDGRFIVFTSTRRGKREIFVMDYDGSSPHPLVEDLKGRSYTPAWSQ